MTNYEEDFQNEVAGLGCIACHIDGRRNEYVSIHHIDGRTKPGCEMQVLPLCGAHHQTGGESVPSLHPWKRRFENKYGSQAELLALVHEMLGNKWKAPA